MICMDARQSLGVYVIGSLPMHEAIEVREHLGVCPECRAEHHELAGLPAMLGMISEVEATFGPVKANDEMLDRLLAQVGTERRSQSRRNRVLGAVAAVVFLAGGGGAVWAALPGLRDQQQSPEQRTVTAANRSTGVRAALLYGPAATGTWTNLRLSGVPNGVTCRLVVVGRDGKRQVVSGWQSTDTHTGTAEMNTQVAIRPEAISRFEVMPQQKDAPLVVLPL